ncbi:MAG: L-serine ammonia-lyase [Candidatus Cloacimonetes bacterium]|jgi:L-serine dehydratase|nr:L-serine ammonia-lyase [Candidatus Cloacimonadota bacterium]
METIKELFKIGHGPSSSHTMGPQRAASIFKEKNPNAYKVIITLYGSLAATGKGHLTDKILIETFYPIQCELIWKPVSFLTLHPNGLDFEAYDIDNNLIDKWRVYSVGGGSIKDDENFLTPPDSPYSMSTMNELLRWCDEEGRTFWEYVELSEGKDIWDFLKQIWTIMKEAIAEGLEQEGVLPGTLKVARKASTYYVKANNVGLVFGQIGLAFAYALAVSEQNASGGKVVTAPTCGSCGVLPAVLMFLQKQYNFSDKRILNALATAGLIGNLIKTNASISGAEVGCQGEIGTACAMAAGAAIQLLGGSPAQIEYAAEMGLEHHLGLTCDPIGGYVQIPCIERNAVAAARALECASYSMFSDGKHRIPFDTVVETMNITGRDLQASYRETSTGGLAKEWSKILRF